jgi:RNA polymerase sigma factor (sigma-70 family)
MKDKGKDRRFGPHFVDFYNSSLAYGRKKRRRIRHLNSADEAFGQSDEEMEKQALPELSSEGSHQATDVKYPRKEEIILMVGEAIKKLLPIERQFVACFYFEGKSYKEISVILNKDIRKLERIHNHALAKLKMLLYDYVKTRFKFNVPKETGCIICKSPFRQELDKLIQAKKEKETYKSLIRIFKGKYGLDIKTPQVIIGHKKKHMI